MRLSAEPHVAFRVDGGFDLGLGHLTRCLTLAAELGRRGAVVDFITRPLPDGMSERITANGYGHRVLPEWDDLPSAGSVWSTEAQQRDAEQTRDLSPGDLAVLVVDHYGLGLEWEQSIRPLAGRLLVIDDLANREHLCDVLLDQNWSGPETFSRYDALVSADTTLLLGPRYALLDPSYARLREEADGKGLGEERRIVVSFGGSDPTGETRKVLEAMGGMDLSRYHVDVVLGAGSREREDALRYAASGTSVVFHSNLPSLAGLFGQADLAIGAGGTTIWERICLGVPSLVATAAPNQVPVTSALHEAGAIEWVGDGQETTPEQYRSHIQAALHGGLPTPPPIVDGWGARRVALALLGPEETALELRPATQADAPALIGAGMTRRTERGTSGEASGWLESLGWLRSDLDEPGSLPLIVIRDAAPIGFVRLHRRGNHAAASYWLDDGVSRTDTEVELARVLDQTAWDVAAGGLVTKPAPSAQKNVLPIVVAAWR